MLPGEPNSRWWELSIERVIKEHFEEDSDNEWNPGME